MGFRRADLLCSSCDLLPKFNLDHIKTNCDLCCQQGGSKQPIKKYPSARLEVCGWKIGHYPQIQAFVKSNRPDQFPGLMIQYVRGADPVIKMMDEEGNVQEELSIQKWDTDTVEEFLTEHLK